MTTRWVLRSIVALGASSAVAAQQAPPVRPLGPIVAKTTDPIDRVSVRPLSDGRVVVNDGLGRRVLLFDASLSKYTVLMDTSGTTRRKYPSRSFASILPFRGDSTLFYDGAAMALVVLDPAGEVTRTMAAPFPPDAGYLSAWPGARFDPEGRAVYRASISALGRPTASGFRLIPADSAPIVRATPGAAAPETLAYIRLPQFPKPEPFTTKGHTIQRQVIDPFVLQDEWAVLPDGTLGIIRGHDYHIDWVAPDGTRSASAKLPFQWHRLSDSDKTVIVDSVKRWAEANPYRMTSFGAAGSFDDTIPAGAVSPADLADYRPPFARGAMLADGDGNVWLLPTPETPLSPNPGPVYDIVSRAGTLIDRVQITPGFSIVAFAPGYVFMTIREGTTTVLAKARIR